MTQNVDGFHGEAGSRNVIEVHGNLHRLICTVCELRFEAADYSALNMPPACRACGGLVRPEVVLFGEMLPEDALAKQERELAQGFDMIFAIGTTAVFPYIYSPVMLARSQAVPTVEINPGETLLSDIVEYRLPLGAADGLGRIWERYQQLL